MAQMLCPRQNQGQHQRQRQGTRTVRVCKPASVRGWDDELNRMCAGSQFVAEHAFDASSTRTIRQRSGCKLPAGRGLHAHYSHSCHFAFYCSTLTPSTPGTRQRANMYPARREAHADVDALLAAKHVSRAKHRGHRIKQIVQWSTGSHLPITPMIPPPVPTTTASRRPPSQLKHFDEPLQHQRTGAGSSD